VQAIMDDQTRLFDLNIEKILEAWDNAHAIRELISNALDEQVLTRTADIKICKEADGTWTVRDFGRGLRYEHFTQNENPEKLKNVGLVIGKFGVGRLGNTGPQ
jgi:DNA gyrase/topoisomerase IV subunit B